MSTFNFTTTSTTFSLNIGGTKTYGPWDRTEEIDSLFNIELEDTQAVLTLKNPYFSDIIKATDTVNLNGLPVTGTLRTKVAYLKDNVLFLPPASALSTALNALSYGMIGDNIANNDAAYLAALNASNTAKVPLYIPAGIYKTSSSFAYPELTFFSVIGDGKSESIIKGGYANLSTPKMVVLGTGAVCRAKDVSFQGFNYIFYSGAAVSEITITDCYFKDNRDYCVRLEDADLTAASDVKYLRFENNVLENTPGIAPRGGVSGSAIVTKNNFKNVTRDQTLYQLSGGGSIDMFAVCIGSTNDVDPAITQQKVLNVKVTDNVVDGLYNPTQVSRPSIALVVTGLKVIMERNMVINVSSNMNTGAESLYTKATEASISYNIVINGVCSDPNNAAIEVKGVQQGGALKPYSYRVKVHGNQIYETSTGSNGIATYGGASIDLYNNKLSGFNNAGIVCYSSPDALGLINYRMSKNELDNIKGVFGISIRSEFLENVVITDNTLTDITGNVANLANYTNFIKVLSTTSYVKSVRITGNKLKANLIDNTKMAGMIAIWVNTPSGQSLTDCIVTDNSFEVISNSFTTTPKPTFIDVGNAPALVTKSIVKDNVLTGDVSNVDVKSIVGNASPFIYGISSNFASTQIGPNYKNGVRDTEGDGTFMADANFTVNPVTKYYVLPAITANRTVTMLNPASYVGEEFVFENRNNNVNFAWAFTGTYIDIRRADGLGSANIANQSLLKLRSNGSYWYATAHSFDLFTTKAGAPTTSDIQSGHFKGWKNSTDGRFGFYFNDIGTIKQLLPTGSATITGDGSTTVFSVTHSVGFTPAYVAPLDATNAAAATALKLGYFISAKGATTFDVTFQTAPAAGSITFDWLVK